MKHVQRHHCLSRVFAPCLPPLSAFAQSAGSQQALVAAIFERLRSVTLSGASAGGSAGGSNAAAAAPRGATLQLPEGLRSDPRPSASPDPLRALATPSPMFGAASPGGRYRFTNMISVATQTQPMAMATVPVARPAAQGSGVGGGPVEGTRRRLSVTSEGSAAGSSGGWARATPRTTVRSKAALIQSDVVEWGPRVPGMPLRRGRGRRR